MGGEDLRESSDNVIQRGRRQRVTGTGDAGLSIFMARRED